MLKHCKVNSLVCLNLPACLKGELSESFRGLECFDLLMHIIRAIEPRTGGVSYLLDKLRHRSLGRKFLKGPFLDEIDVLRTCNDTNVWE